MKKMMIALAGGVALLASALGLAPPAQADAASYLAAIYASPHGFSGPPSAYMYLGSGVCQFTALGSSHDAMTKWVVQESGPGIWYPQAAYIVTAARAALCYRGA